MMRTAPLGVIELPGVPGRRLMDEMWQMFGKTVENVFVTL